MAISNNSVQNKSMFETYSSFFGNLVILVGVIVFMILHFYYFHTMKKIKCKCVDNDYQGKIKFFIILQIILFSLLVVTSMILAKFSPNNVLLILTNKILFLLAIVCMFVTTYFIRLFLTSIDEGKCKCSKSGLKTFIDIVNKIKIILFAIYIIIALSLPILIKDFMNKNVDKIKEGIFEDLHSLTKQQSNTIKSASGTVAAPETTTTTLATPGTTTTLATPGTTTTLEGLFKAEK